MKRASTLLLTVGLALLFISETHAALIATADFDDLAAGSSLVGQAGGTGFTGNWTGDSAAKSEIVTPSPLDGSVNAAKLFGGDGGQTMRNRAVRPLATTLPNDGFYFSFEGRYDGLDSGDFFALWFDTSGALGDSHAHSNIPNFGIRDSGGPKYFMRTGNLTGVNVGTPADEETFRMVGYMYNGDTSDQSDNTLRLWIDPTIKDAKNWDAQLTGVPLRADMSHLGVRMGSNTENSDALYIDNLRIGTSFHSVTHPLMAGLDGYWTLDETSGDFADRFAYGNALTPSGSPHGDGANGVLGGALSLDGGGDRAYAANSSVGAYGVEDSFTVSMWLQVPSALSDFHWFAGREHGGDAAGWALRNGVSGGRDDLRFQFRAQPGAPNLSLDAEDVFTAANAGEWMFLAATYDYDGADAVMSLYLDGELLKSDTVTPGSSANYLPGAGTRFSVGARHNDAGGAVDGLIDEVALWSRVLSAGEIAMLYNNGAGLRVPEPASAAMLVMLLLAVAGLRPRRQV